MNLQDVSAKSGLVKFIGIQSPDNVDGKAIVAKDGDGHGMTNVATVDEIEPGQTGDEERVSVLDGKASRDQRQVWQHLGSLILSQEIDDLCRHRKVQKTVLDLSHLQT